jgi:hypothetical protein
MHCVMHGLPHLYIQNFKTTHMRAATVLVWYHTSSHVKINSNSLLSLVACYRNAFGSLKRYQSFVFFHHHLYEHIQLLSSSSSSSLARQPYVGPGLPQKLLPAEATGYCFFRFRDKSLFQGGVVSPTPNPRLSWRADVFYQGCLP